MSKVNPKDLRGYKEVFTIEHGHVSFTLGYNPKPHSKTDYYRLDIKDYNRNKWALLLCRQDIGAIITLLGMAVKGVKPSR